MKLDFIQNKSANIYYKDNLVAVCTDSGHRLMGIDLSAGITLFDNNYTDYDIGKAIRSALAKSRLLTVPEAEVFFEYQAMMQRYKDFTEQLKKFGKFSSNRALNNKLQVLEIEEEDEKYLIFPMNKDKIDQWSRTEQVVKISKKVSDEEFGRTLTDLFNKKLS